jgi:hypothetical protein
MSVTFFSNDEVPEANFSNANARNLLGLLGIETDPELCGEIPHDQIASVRREITRARNGDRSQALTPSSVSREANGPLLIECGSTDEQVLYRLEKLDMVLRYAQEQGFSVHWG